MYTSDDPTPYISECVRNNHSIVPVGGIKENSEMCMWRREQENLPVPTGKTSSVCKITTKVTCGFQNVCLGSTVRQSALVFSVYSLQSHPQMKTPCMRCRG